MPEGNLREQYPEWRMKMRGEMEPILAVTDPKERVERIIDLIAGERVGAADKALDRTHWGLGWGD